jgi:hypothetical protein
VLAKRHRQSPHSRASPADIVMQLPKFFQRDSLTRLAQGAAVGAAATMIIGFNWGGWVLGKTAENNAATLVNAALVKA